MLIVSEEKLEVCQSGMAAWVSCYPGNKHQGSSSHIRKDKTTFNPLNMFGIPPSSITCIRLTLTVNQPKQEIYCQRKVSTLTAEDEVALRTSLSLSAG